MSQRIRTAFVGLNPNSHWAAAAHMPALNMLRDRFEVVGVANSNAESSRHSAEAFGLAHAFPDVDTLVASDAVDLVVVTVKVPHHHTLVTKALKAGKHVFCEWPLGNGLSEAEDLAKQARQTGLVAAVGTQARVAPEILQLKSMIAEGVLGEVLSSSILAEGPSWGAKTSSDQAYLFDKANGATLLSIPMGHTLSALQEVLGEVGDFDARMRIRQPEVQLTDKDTSLIRSTPDDVMVIGEMQSGASLCIHFRGGALNGTGLLWEIRGTRGTIQIRANTGHVQMEQLDIGVFTDTSSHVSKNSTAPARALSNAKPAVRNVALLYDRVANDIINVSRSSPNFDDAVNLHRLLENIELTALHTMSEIKERSAPRTRR